MLDPYKSMYYFALSQSIAIFLSRDKQNTITKSFCWKSSVFSYEKRDQTQKLLRGWKVTVISEGDIFIYYFTFLNCPKNEWEMKSQLVNSTVHTLIIFYFRYLYNCKDVTLRRNTAGSLGFCIVGGYEEYTGNKPFFIKSIVEGTPAYNDGRIR